MQNKWMSLVLNVEWMLQKLHNNCLPLLEGNYSDYHLYLIQWRFCSTVSLEYPFL